LRRDVHRERSQVDPDHFFKERDDEAKSGAAKGDEASQTKYYASFVFFEDFEPSQNNAEHHRAFGIGNRAGVETARAEMDVNYFGLLRLAQEFGPALRARGADGLASAVAWVNVLSIYALANFPPHGTFSASKAAAHSLAQCLRAEMRPAGVRVVNVFPGPIDDEWNQLVLSWNATAAPGTFITIEACAIQSSHITKFYTWGLWSPDDKAYPRASIVNQKDADGDVRADTLALNTPAKAVQIRLTLGGTGWRLKRTGDSLLGISYEFYDIVPNETTLGWARARRQACP